MRLSFILAGCLSFALAFAETLVIYPLDSQDVLLGYAVADQLGQAFEDKLELIGPEVAANLEAPIIVEGGFLSLRRLSVSVASPEGSSLARSIIGADKVLTGNIDFVNGQLEAHYFLATAAGVKRFIVTAPEDDPSLLVSRSMSQLALRLDLKRPDFSASIDLSSSYADYVRALALLSFGDLTEAAKSLQLALAESPNDRMRSLLAHIEAVQVGAEGEDPVLMAALSLSNTPVDEALAIRYFETLAAERALPVATTWVATLKASREDAGTAAAFAQAAALYPFGAAAQAAYLAQQEAPFDSSALLAQEDFASLLTVAMVAQGQDDTGLEKEALGKLSQLQPSYVYPFERLSFIAFDEDDALAAGKALAIATRLEPDSDLYWTNLGWAYYLLGVLDKSETASVRAIELDPTQFIALFNLGLVRVVTDRLAEAMEAYAEAIALDPEVDDEAVLDLVNALELYPQQPGVHYALASLYEQEGRREEAAEQFEYYLAASPEAPFDRFARQRIAILRAPPAAIEISEGVRIGLGSKQLASAGIQAGDRLYSSFELFTPGAELPSSVGAAMLLKTSTGEILLENEQAVEIPRNAIGYVIDLLYIDVPSDLADGNYVIELLVTASEDRQAGAEIEIELLGQASLLRQLISRSITMTDIANASPLYASEDLARADTYLIDILLQELSATADLAEEALPIVETGRFEGLSGAALFNSSTEQDIRDFLQLLLSNTTGDSSFTFVDAYAQWALEGAETRD